MSTSKMKGCISPLIILEDDPKKKEHPKTSFPIMIHPKRLFFLIISIYFLAKLEINSYHIVLVLIQTMNYFQGSERQLAGDFFMKEKMTFQQPSNREKAIKLLKLRGNRIRKILESLGVFTKDSVIFVKPSQLPALAG